MLALGAGVLALPSLAIAADELSDPSVKLGPRPGWLVNDMDDGDLKDALEQCKDGPFYRTDWSIGHRGAPLLFPEHTVESYIAAAEMGAGILECDVTFTKDRELVCRHAQCDLHTTTNILVTDLAEKCSEPFTPAKGDTPASARCCTSDLTLDEFKSLEGKMDAANSAATTPEEYLDGTASFRTDLYVPGKLLTHKESIELFKDLDAKFTPELKSPQVEMPFEGDYTQEMYAQQLIDEYKDAGVKPRDVWPQSFNLNDVFYWIRNEKQYGKQAVYLDGRYDLEEFDFEDPSTWSPTMEELVDHGVRIIAPPTWMLVTLDKNDHIVPSIYAKRAQEAGLEIIGWTIERSGRLAEGGGFYYQSVSDVIDNDGDMLVLMDVLAQDVGIIGLFSDWPATTTFYANCFNLE